MAIALRPAWTAGLVGVLVLSACGSAGVSPSESDGGGGADGGPTGEIVTLTPRLVGQGQDPITQAALEFFGLAGTKQNKPTKNNLLDVTSKGFTVQDKRANDVGCNQSQCLKQSHRLVICTYLQKFSFALRATQWR